jgi:hypothetical protein
LFSFLYILCKLYLIIATAQVLAGDDGNGAVFTGLLADSAADAFSIIHDPGFALNHFQQGIRSIYDALETAAAFFTIDFNSHQTKS